MPISRFVVLIFALYSHGAFSQSSGPVDVRDFVARYAAQEIKDIILDRRVMGPVYLKSELTPGWITKEEFYSVLLSVNFCAYEEDGVINVVENSHIKGRKLPVFDGRNRGDLVPSQTVNGVIEVQNRSAEEFVPLLKPLVERWGYLAADPQTNTLSVVTSMGNVERLVEIVRRLDRQASL
jgi:general secretion pathway protein D